MNSESVTQLLRRIESGEEDAKEELVGEVYSELHNMACHYLSKERAGHTLQPTALVNEVYLKMFQGISSGGIEDRQHLLGTAAKAMRQLLIDHARSRKSLKRGGAAQRESLDHIVEYYEERGIQILDLDDALKHLTEMDGELGQVVELKFFGGRTNKEVAEIMKTSERSVDRAWFTARAWLRQKLESHSSKPADL